MHINLKFISKNCEFILNILNLYGAESRLVGGCVRDALLGLPIKDIDIVTSLLPQETVNILKKYPGVTLLTLGIEFGTITAVIEGEYFEITTARKDLSCDGRWAEVEFTRDFRIDAERRDFTINAMSYSHVRGELYDYFGGEQDLKSRKVRFIGNPYLRIREDYLRILRFFRFSINYAEILDFEGLTACRDLIKGIESLSMERIRVETDKIIFARSSDAVLEHMKMIGLLHIIFSIDLEIQPLKKLYENLKLRFDKYGDPITLAGSYAVLFSNNLSLSKTELTRYKFTKIQTTKIINILSAVKELRDNSKDCEFVLKKTWFIYRDSYKEYLFIYAALRLISWECG
jgi:poly(A) polymerase